MLFFIRALKPIPGRGRKGFTLLELLMVVIIVGILGALAIPNYIESQKKSYSAEAWSNLNALLEAMQIYYVDHSYTWTTTVASLPADNPNSKPKRKFDYSIAESSGTAVLLASPVNTTVTGSNKYKVVCSSCGAAGESITRYQGSGCTTVSGSESNCTQVGG